MYQEIRSTPFLAKWRNKIQFLSDHCSLPVVGYVISPSRVPFFKRIFWLITTLACCFCSVNVLQGALSLYTSGAISYLVETDYLEFDTPFPALTICEYVQLESDTNAKHITKYLEENNLPLKLAPFVKDVSYWHKKFCSTCPTCQLGHSCVEDFMELINGVRRKCTDLLSSCSWNDKPFSCCERCFHYLLDPKLKAVEYITRGDSWDKNMWKDAHCTVQIFGLTEYGTCFVFNSRLTGNKTVYTVNRHVGLHTLTFEAREDVIVRIHSPDDMVSVGAEKLVGSCEILPLVSEFDVILSAKYTISDVSVERLAPSNRDCLYKHEKPEFAHLWPFTTYSHNTCLLYCRAIAQAEACNCTHHFMPTIGDIPKCDFNGLICLNKRKDRLGNDKYYCPMSCDEVTYEVVHVTCPRYFDLKHGTRGCLRLGNLPTLRVRRQAIRELLGLVVDVGGVIGVFFGASLLSFIEIFYLLFIRKYR